MKGVPFSFAGEGYCVVGETVLILPEAKFAFTWIKLNDEGERWFMNPIVYLHLAVSGDGPPLTLINDKYKYLQ